MSLSHRRPPHIYEQRIEYIDAGDHPSAVGYRVYRTQYGGFDAEVELLGCDRKIHWQFDNRSKDDFERGVMKIDRAIGLLTMFREAYIKHGKNFRRRKRK